MSDVVLVVPLRAMYPTLNIQIEPQTDFSEEGYHRYSCLVRRALAEQDPEPAIWQPLPEGTWAVHPDGRTSYQLRRFALDDPRLRFDECRPDDSDLDLAYRGKHVEAIARYVAWLRAGHDTPPIRGLETERGNVNVIQGHHRAVARHRAGYRDILVWVSPFDEPLAPYLKAAS